MSSLIHLTQGLSAFAPEKAAIQAGRAMLERMRYLAKNGENFAFETTLASRTFAPWIAKLKSEKGYSFHLTFLLLDSPELAVSRVAERVKMGGHFVPEDTVHRRFKAGIKNFFNLYKPLANLWQIYDNTHMDNLVPIASQLNDLLEIHHAEIWQNLLEKYNDISEK